MNYAGAAHLEGALLECLYVGRLRRRDGVENGLGRLGMVGCSHPQGDIAVYAVLRLSTIWVSGYQKSVGLQETPTQYVVGISLHLALQRLRDCDVTLGCRSRQRVNLTTRSGSRLARMDIVRAVSYPHSVHHSASSRDFHIFF